MRATTDSYQRPGFRAAVLSLSLLTIMSGAGVAPGIDRIAAAFPDTPDTVIKLIVSLPPLFMICAALLTGMLGNRARHKALIVTGLALFLAGGVGAGYADSMPGILFFRAILGLGTGVILPYSTGLIGACYEGRAKQKMIGYSFAANNLGAITGNILAGSLAAIHWSSMFHIYWMGLISLVPVLLFLNDLPEDKGLPEKGPLPSGVFLCAMIAMLVMMVFFLVVTNLAFITGTRGIGGPRTTGYLFAVNTLTMLCAGILSPSCMRLRRYFLPAVGLFIGCGLGGIASATKMPAMFFSVILTGFGLGSLFPSVLNRAAGLADGTQSVKVMSIVMAFAWFGQFLSPLFFGAVASLAGCGTHGLFMSVAAVFLFLSGGSLVFHGLIKNKP